MFYVLLVFGAQLFWGWMAHNLGWNFYQGEIICGIYSIVAILGIGLYEIKEAIEGLESSLSSIENSIDELEERDTLEDYED